MGKGILILVMASTMAGSYMYASRDDGMFRRAETEADYQSKILARETAQSAFNLLVGKVKRDYEGYRGSYSDLDYGKAKYDIAAIDGVNSVTLLATGKYGDFSYEITGTINKTGARLLDALTLDGPIEEFDFADSFTISGLDTYPNGNRSDGPDVHAVLTNSSDTYSAVYNEASSSSLAGVNGNRDVINDSPEIDLDEIESSIRNYSGDALMAYSGNKEFNNASIGSAENMKVVRVKNGNLTLSGNTTGYGVLYVNEGNLKLEDNAKWNGLVFVNQPNVGAHSIKDYASVFGAMILRSADNSGTPPDDDDDDDNDDPGLSGGSFDIDVFGGDSETVPVLHVDDYDDDNDVTGIDLLSAGCNPGVCWSSLVTDQADEATFTFENKSASSGTYDIRLGSTVYSGSTNEAISITLDPSKVTKFDIEFSSLNSMVETSAETVQGDPESRGGAWTIQASAAVSGCSTKSGKEGYWDKSGKCKKLKSKKKKSDKGAVASNEIIYELSVYQNTELDQDADPGCELKSKKKSKKKSCKSAKKSKKSDKSDKSKKSDKSGKSDKSDKSGKSDKGDDDSDDSDDSDSSKIDVCHAPPGNPGNKQTLSIGLAAKLAHILHGDVLGRCESDVFTEEGSPNSLSISGFGRIQYSSSTIRPIKNLLAQIEMEENGFSVRKVAEVPSKLVNGLLSPK